MPRRLSPTFIYPAIQDLTRQLLYVPPQRRIQQILRAEQLHDQLEPDQNYPLDFVLYRITGFRSDYAAQELLSGRNLAADLRLLIDRLSFSVDMPAEAFDPVLRPQDLARRLHVHPRTLLRWRRLGLRWRWVRFPGHAHHLLVYPSQAVDHFLAQHPDLLPRALRLHHLSDQDRQRILRRARRLVAAGFHSLHQIASHLARRTGHSLQTIRQLLIRYDRDHPNQPLFPRRSPLTPRQRRFILRAHRLGIPTRRICQRLGKNRSTVLRVIHRARAQELLKLNLSYFYLPTFDHPDAPAVYQRDEPAPVSTSSPPISTADLPPALAPLYHHPLPDDQALFRLLIRLNYFKYQAHRLLQHLNPLQPRASELRQIESHLHRARILRSRIARAGLPLVLLAVRRHLAASDQASPAHLLDLLEQIHPVLYQAIDRFDITGPATSFSAFLNWHLARHLATLLPADAASPPRAARRQDPQLLLERLLQQARSFDIDPAVLLPPESSSPP